MYDLNPMVLIDFYKADHKSQYPKGTSLVYSNFTPRKSRVPGVDHMVFFGLQYAVKEYLIHRFNTYFFHRPKHEVVAEYKHLMDCSLGRDAIEVSHIGDLHDLGYLPMRINAVKEGTAVPMGTPAVTMWNTHPSFAWLTNYLETLVSCLLWQPCTSATTAGQFYRNFVHYAKSTGADLSMVPFLGHDFSFRGMPGTEAAMMSGAAHNLFFVGTDTVPAILFLRKYYEADLSSELIGCSVPATEHSVMSAGGDENEFQTYRRLITEVYPQGIVSIVSDTWDFWNVVTDFLPRLKDDIMRRYETGKAPVNRVVIRPDSGVPHKILCGDRDADSEPEKKGLVRCLAETFGVTANAKGYMTIHPAIGYIYGDSITLDEQEKVLAGLSSSGFTTCSGVLGIGSYTYQYVTRDTYGTVCKATYCEVDGKPREIFKSPKTGGWKKSHRGLLRVNEDLTCNQQVSWSEEGGILEPVFVDGQLKREHTLKEIRDRVQ